MRRFLLIGLAAAALGTPGCAREGATTVPARGVEEEQPAAGPVILGPMPREVPVFVIRARYYRTKGPCVRIGDALAMPVVDGFEVVEVAGGELKATRIEVRPLSAKGANYPGKLAEGQTYTLCLTPSADTLRQLRENEREGYSFLWIDGEELSRPQLSE